MDARYSYREASIRGASPVRLVVCLYEQAIIDLRRAAMALEKGDIETRTREINHALLVLAHLQGSIDVERGGEVARNLQRFYNLVRAGLVEAQMKQSRLILEQQISQLTLVHEAWQQLERDMAAPSGRSVSAHSAASSSESGHTDWNA